MKPPLDRNPVAHSPLTVSVTEGALTSTRVRPIKMFLSPAVVHRTTQDARVAAALGSLLEPYLSDFHIRLACAKDALIVFCKDRGVATEIRFMQREMLKLLLATGYGHLQAVRIRLAATPIERSAEERSEIQREMTENTRKLIRSAALRIVDARLRKALNRLADVQAR